MKILCNDCQHKIVCIFSDDYANTINNLKENVSTPFTLELKCPHYSAIKQMFGRSITDPYATVATNDVSTKTAFCDTITANQGRVSDITTEA